MASYRRMARRRASLAFRDRVVPDPRWHRISHLHVRQGRMAPANVSAAARSRQRHLDVRLLHAAAKDAAAGRLLQWAAAARIYLGDYLRHRDGAVRAGDLQTGATPFPDG